MAIFAVETKNPASGGSKNQTSKADVSLHRSTYFRLNRAQSQARITRNSCAVPLRSRRCKRSVKLTTQYPSIASGASRIRAQYLSSNYEVRRNKCKQSQSPNQARRHMTSIIYYLERGGSKPPKPLLLFILLQTWVSSSL